MAVQPFGRSLGHTVRHRLHQQRSVAVALGLETSHIILSMHGHGKRSYIITLGGHIVGHSRITARLIGLLTAQSRKSHLSGHYIVTLRTALHNCRHAAYLARRATYLLYHATRVTGKSECFRGLVAPLLLLLRLQPRLLAGPAAVHTKGIGKRGREFPCTHKGSIIDQWQQFLTGYICHSAARTGRGRGDICVTRSAHTPHAGLGERSHLSGGCLALMLLAQTAGLLLERGDISLPHLGVEQTRCEQRILRGVSYMYHGPFIPRVNLKRGVQTRSGRSAHHQRYMQPGLAHLLGHMGHLVERRGNEARQTHYIGPLSQSGLHNSLGRHHHTKVYHLIVVAGQHYRHYILAYVMHITLHCGKEHLAALACRGGRHTLAAVYLGLQYGHRALHGAGGLDHLGQKHLAFAKQGAHPVHPLHERTVNNGHRLHACLESFAQVLGEISTRPVHECVAQTLVQRQCTPLLGLRRVVFSLFGPFGCH